MIELHSMPTPNGQKVMIMLEETGLEWKHVDVNIHIGEQFSASYLKLSPNNKIPAIVDTEGPGGRYTMMESGAILVYLAEKTGRFLRRMRAGATTSCSGSFSRWHTLVRCSVRRRTSTTRPGNPACSTRATATTTRRRACTRCLKTG